MARHLVNKECLRLNNLIRRIADLLEERYGCHTLEELRKENQEENQSF